MTLVGHKFKKGEAVPLSVVRKIPEGRYRSLVNVGLLKEFPDEPKAKPEPVVEETTATVETEPTGTMCPECGAGPFKRLDRHMTKHEGA